MKMKAIWKDTVLAESDDTVVIEGNHYFPPDSLNMEYFRKTETLSACPWKGLASYYSIEVDGNVNQEAAWYYKDPNDLAKNIKNHVAFWKGIIVQ